jgi:two-component system, OmpR family, response regulator
MRPVLVFDDDPQVAELLEAALTEAGCTVFRADSFGQAVTLIERESIKVALVDMPMVRFTGRKLAAYAAARGIKVLMMPAGADAALRAEAADLPYIVKPFRVAEIVDTVADMLPGA